MEQFPARLRRQYHDDIARDARALKKWASGLPAATSHPTPNTVHLSILMAFLISIGGRGFARRGRSGKLLILRLIPRGLRRLRLETTRSSRISLSTLS